MTRKQVGRYTKRRDFKNVSVETSISLSAAIPSYGIISRAFSKMPQDMCSYPFKRVYKRRHEVSTELTTEIVV